MAGSKKNWIVQILRLSLMHCAYYSKIMSAQKIKTIINPNEIGFCAVEAQNTLAETDYLNLNIIL